MRDLLEGTANFPGGSGTVFDYCLDPSRHAGSRCSPLHTHSHACTDAHMRSLAPSLLSSLTHTHTLTLHPPSLMPWRCPPRNFSLSTWDTHVPKFRYVAGMPYFQILVPTVDTTRFSFLLETCLEVGGCMHVCVCACTCVHVCVEGKVWTCLWQL